ncbi:DNA repair exonuclease [Candidatus Woesearchaeota archaeon]|nr:DNA repair exonuclease [Candidatus Woesearchaeota archaeon]
MKYAHLADLHLGSWRDEKMRALSTKAFLQALDKCEEEKVDFLIFAGDLFNTALPSLDTLKIVTRKLKYLHDKNIPLYAIAGSHDFSPSGKTMLDVLEQAGLLKNVCKGKVDPESKRLNLNFTIDQKTGVKLCGLLGRRGLLDRAYYENLNLQNLEEEPGYKIFMFHTTLTELKPKHLEKLDSQPASFLPKNFNYYAGGHIHHPTKLELDNYGPLTYPGALFPNNFGEMERYSKGGFYIIEVADKEKSDSAELQLQKPQQQISWIPLEVIKHHHFELDCQNKSPAVISFELNNHFNGLDLKDTLISLRLKGMLQQGRASDIEFKEVFEQLYQQGAYFIMKNTAELNTEAYEEINLSTGNSESMEEEIIKEHLQQVTLFEKERELNLTKSLLQALNTTKKEGETVTDFNQRVEEETNRVLQI